jgi:GTP-binding protein EngB required for normal cell division
MVPNLDPAALSQLQNADAKTLLDTVDSLRAFGVDKLVSLPQIIVCGDTSSGKSSVLEAISRVPFPAHDGCCTKFATELSMRQSPTSSSRVSIRPGPSRTGGEKAALESFAQVFTSPDDFPGLVESAGNLMSTASAIANPNGFFEDVLCVEVTGPQQPHLTIIDLPGFLQSATTAQSKNDPLVVEKLVTSYMRSTRSIILAVVNANNTYGNQVVLNHAKKLDPNGDRTMGIITKPDLVEDGSALENEVRTLVLNENPLYHFSYGWHILRNRSHTTRNISSEERDRQEESYFGNSLWQTILPSDHLGIATLRTRLSNVSLDKIRSDLPTVSEKIRTELARCKHDLKALGDARFTPEQYRRHLIQVSNQINRLSADATKGMYSSNPNFFTDEQSTNAFNRKLRSAVRRYNLVFVGVMRNYGHKWEINDRRFPSLNGDKAVEKITADLELSHPAHLSTEDFRRKIADIDERDHGQEVEGTTNPLLISNLFHKQSSRWGCIAQHHLDEVQTLAMEFLAQVLQYVADESTARGMMDEYIRPFMKERAEILEKKLEELLLPYREGHVSSYSPLMTGGLSNIQYVVPEDFPGQHANAQTGQIDQYDDILRKFQILYEVSILEECLTYGYGLLTLDSGCSECIH